MKFDIVGVGNALVDETFYVDKQFVDSTDLFLEGTYQSTKAFKKGLYQIDPMEMFSTRLGLRYKF